MTPDPFHTELEQLLDLEARLDRIDDWLDATGIGRLTTRQRDLLRDLWTRDP